MYLKHARNNCVEINRTEIRGKAHDMGCIDTSDSESRIFWFSLFEDFWLQNPQTSTETSPKRVSR